MQAFGRHLGIAFQCVDYLFGIWGDETGAGKPALSDIRARKVTLPVAAALAERTPQSESLRGLHRRQTVARDWTVHQARRHTETALEHLSLVHPAPVPAAELADLAQLLTCRDH
ncbi:polyprenyl synthetase family protein [Streptomyces sp. NPDC059003]|uniref:polyprenyl synthetase family protein n=1 Tax=Streptomyces sp. NPDC059003 TaxID=3346691 RepID=UPI0036BA8DDA